MDTIGNLLASAVVRFLDILVNGLTAEVGKTMADVLGGAAGFLDSGYVQSAVGVTQAVAGALLGLKVAAEALRVWILQTSGDPGADPGGLLRRTALAAGMVGFAPDVARLVYRWGADLAAAIGGGADIYTSQELWGIATTNGAAVSTALVGALLMALPAVVLLVILLVQAAIRAVELAFLCVAGPVMAVGLTQENEGLMGLWWRELLVLSVTQAAQVFLLKGALGMGITLSPLLAVAFLWVAVRAPSVLRTMAYHTGVGTAAGSAAQAAGTAVIFRRLAARGV